LVLSAPRQTFAGTRVQTFEIHKSADSLEFAFSYSIENSFGWNVNKYSIKKMICIPCHVIHYPGFISHGDLGFNRLESYKPGPEISPIQTKWRRCFGKICILDILGY
jgi:hypothetical protein